MKILLVSDVHVEFHADGGRNFIQSLDPDGVDVLVLAGDIAVGAGIPEAIGGFCDRFHDSRVVYVHGNHEHYGHEREAVVAATEEAARHHENLVWLDSDVREIGGRRFLGGTLWFRETADTHRRRRGMADFEAIPSFETWVYRENQRMLDLLERELREGDIIVTHHLPSYKSVAARYSGNPLNVYFVCDLADLITERRPLLWLHGHTHSSVDVRLGSTRVLCNPFGYVGWELNPNFREGVIVEIPPSLRRTAR